MFKDKYYCGLDIGSQRTRAGVIRVKNPMEIELVDVFENPTHGFKDDSVKDLSELSECVHSTIEGLSEKVGIRIREVALGIGSYWVDANETSTVIPLIDKGSKVITSSDIRNVTDQARILGTKMDEEILHTICQEFTVDDNRSAINPLGLYGRKLGNQQMMIVADVNRIRNITKAINHAGYDIGNLFFNSFVASDITLDEEEKKNGCVLIDIGSRMTSIMLFRDKALRCLKKINFGGDNFTRSIASELKMTFDLSEEIKKSYAAAGNYDLYEDEEILVKNESVYITLKRAQIYSAVNPQVDNFLEQITGAINDCVGYQNLNCGITLIGGGALMPGLIEKIGESVKMPVKLGKLNVFSQKKFSNLAEIISVVGLAYNAYLKTLKYGVDAKGHSNWAKILSNKIKELYLEYF